MPLKNEEWKINYHQRLLCCTTIILEIIPTVEFLFRNLQGYLPFGCSIGMAFQFKSIEVTDPMILNHNKKWNNNTWQLTYELEY